MDSACIHLGTGLVNWYVSEVTLICKAFQDTNSACIHIIQMYLYTWCSFCCNEIVYTVTFHSVLVDVYVYTQLRLALYRSLINFHLQFLSWYNTIMQNVEGLQLYIILSCLNTMMIRGRARISNEGFLPWECPHMPTYAHVYCTKLQLHPHNQISIRVENGTLNITWLVTGTLWEYVHHATQLPNGLHNDKAFMSPTHNSCIGDFQASRKSPGYTPDNEHCILTIAWQSLHLTSVQLSSRCSGMSFLVTGRPHCLQGCG